MADTSNLAAQRLARRLDSENDYYGALTPAAALLRALVAERDKMRSDIAYLLDTLDGYRSAAGEGLDDEEDALVRRIRRDYPALSTLSVHPSQEPKEDFCEVCHGVCRFRHPPKRPPLSGENEAFGTMQVTETIEPASPEMPTRGTTGAPE